MSIQPSFSQPDDSTTTDRRAEERLPCSLIITCSTPAQSCPATVRDISPVGIGLVSSQSFPSGTTLTIELRQGDVIILSRSVRLRHVRKEGPASWFLGGSFQERLSKKEMKLFV
jgi:hypothetical protein